MALDAAASGLLTQVDEGARAARRTLVTVLALGVAADAALRTLPGGLGWTLWVTALASAALVVARRRGIALTREQAAWLRLAIACAAAFAWRDAEELRVANVLGTLVALGLFSMTAAGLPAASIAIARVRDVIAAGVYVVRDLVFGAPVLVARESALDRLPAVRGGASWTAVRAVLLTAPLVLVFSLLLSRADPVFARVMQIPVLDVPKIVSHVVLMGAFAWWSAGWLRGALHGVAHRPSLPDRLPLALGAAEITTALGAVIALFAVFVALQLRWLFGGADVVLATTGLTVAEYARRGFFELVGVAALVLPLVLGTHAMADGDAVVRRQRRLSAVLLALLAAIMASALLRMQLYVGYFGLSTDRVYATAFMLWLAVVFVAMAATVLRGRARPFAMAAVVSGFTTLLAMNLLDPEHVVARVNLGRPTAVREIDYAYLARLSGDAAPMVVQALRGAAPGENACKAATSLQKRWHRDDDASWNVGAWRGRSAVSAGLSAADVQRLCVGTSGAPPVAVGR